jgi:hypothetical protein
MSDSIEQLPRGPAMGGDFSGGPEARPIYFPPNPPPLGTGIDIRALLDRSPPPGLHAPTTVSRPELRPYETDSFYAPLSTYLDRSSRRFREPLKMDEKQSALFGVFRELREKLLAALRAKIASLENAGPAARLDALEAFAREQEPQLAELENTAEQLRATLARGADWYALREWKLGRNELKPREKTRSLEQQLVRAAAYYQEGFSPAQRRLLRELAMEMEETIFLREGEVPASRYFVFFSPDTARIRLPDDIPAGIKAQLAEYTKQKDALKKELGDAVYDLDKVAFGSTRVKRLAELATEQERRIAALDDIAEEIRRDLVHASGFERTRGPVVLPQELQARVIAWVSEAVRVTRERNETFARTMRSAMAAEIEQARAEAAEGRLDRDSAASMRSAGDRAAAAGQDAVARYNAENAERLAKISAERDALSDEIARAAGPEVEFKVDTLSPAFLAEFIQSQKLARAYREYDAATFEPGLSPAQRRLLFGAAIAALDLPQPGPELQPTAAPRTILR